MRRQIVLFFCFLISTAFAIADWQAVLLVEEARQERIRRYEESLKAVGIIVDDQQVIQREREFNRVRMRLRWLVWEAIKGMTGQESLKAKL